MNNKQIQTFMIGLAMVIVIVKILKKVIRMHRPIMNAKKTFGMPSTRAASLSFIMLFIILNNQRISKKTLTISILVILFCCSLKYFMKEHSILQLCMGSLVGLSIAYYLTKMI